MYSSAQRKDRRHLTGLFRHCKGPGRRRFQDDPRSCFRDVCAWCAAETFIIYASVAIARKNSRSVFYLVPAFASRRVLAGVRPFENPVEDKRHLYRIEASVKVKRYLS